MDRNLPSIWPRSGLLAPAWQVNRTTRHPVLALRGDWVAQSGGIPAFPADGVAGVAVGQTLALDIANVGPVG
jgi:phospholipid/cholesterol/gamma-HCH transport system permease protein